MGTTVSIIVPCYNYARYLPECIESILGQSGVDVRVLIIDDASPDDTPVVAAELLAADPRVEYRRHDRNRGHIATYNEGLDWASGDYTVLLSADDLLVEGSLARAINALDAHPSASLAYGRAVVWNGDSPRPRSTADSGQCAYRLVGGRDWIELQCRTGRNPVYSPEVIVRTADQKSAGGYRSNLPHTGDLEMWLRLASIGNVIELDADQALYRKHGSNMHEAIAPSIVDLEQHWRAFEALFDERSDQFSNTLQLRRLVRRALARQAVVAGSDAVDSGAGRRAGMSMVGRALGYSIVGTLSTGKLIMFMVRLIVGPARYGDIKGAILDVKSIKD